MKVTAFRVAGLCLGASILLAGCVSPEQTQQAIDGPMYPAGYADGCASASEASKPFSTKMVRDEDLFKGDRSYRAGWRQGFSSCGGEDSVFESDNLGNEFEPF